VEEVEQVRIEFTAQGKIVVMQIGLEGIGATSLPPHQTYETSRELPVWIQKRIAVLSLADDDTDPAPHIPKVGTRIGKNIFWVVAPTNEENEDETIHN